MSHPSLQTCVQARGWSAAVATRAQQLWEAVEGNPFRVGDSAVVAGCWIETHTLGCRNAAEEPEEAWWDSHWAIHDEYAQDGHSLVWGDASDGVFLTITPSKD
jgi:hypothetical protein